MSGPGNGDFATMRRILLANERKFQSIVKYAPVAIIIFDTEQNVLLWNPAAQRIFGYGSGETRGKVLASILDEQCREPYHEAMQQLREGNESGLLGQTVEVLGRRKDQSRFPLELNLTSWETDGGLFFIAVGSDITDRKEAERLEVAHRTFKAISQLKDSFIATMSHELRTPLTAVLGYTELVLGNDTLPPGQRRDLTVVIEKTREAIRIVNGLLFLQEDLHTVPQCDNVSLLAIALQVVGSMRRRTENGEPNFQFKVDAPPNLPDVFGDHSAFAILFWHILDNAIKFSPEGGVITVALQDDGADVYCEIADTGIGIAPEHYESIFEPFSQIDGSSTRAYGGMGIGLSLARRVVAVHQGTIGVRSEKIGSTFWFRLPKEGPKHS